MSKKPTPQKRNPNAISDWKEWQDNQYNPGHFTGGKQVPLLKNPGKPVWVGRVLVLMGLLEFGIVVLSIAGMDPHQEEPFFSALSYLPILAISIIMLVAGFRMIKRGRKN